MSRLTNWGEFFRQACGSLLLTNQSTAKLSSDWLGGRYRREKFAWMIEPQVKLLHIRSNNNTLQHA